MSIFQVCRFKTFFVCLALSCVSRAAPAGLSHYVVGCTILDSAGKIVRLLPGQRCVFLPDGRLASATSRDLTLFGPQMQKIWSRPVQNHHQLNLSVTGKQILVMSTGVHSFKGKDICFDRFLVLDLETGQELKSFNTYDTRQELIVRSGRPLRLNPENMNCMASSAQAQFSHANSFYEIGENALSKKIPAFAAGNYIANMNLLSLIIVLDAKLEKILWSLPHQCAHARSQNRLNMKNMFCDRHDVQVQADGTLLLYSNLASDPKADHSAIEQVDPLTRKVTTLYIGNPPQSFRSPALGGVQRLPDGKLLISDITNGGSAFEVDSAGVKIWNWINPSVDSKTFKPAELQQIKKADLTEFLEKNQPL